MEIIAKEILIVTSSRIERDDDGWFVPFDLAIKVGDEAARRGFNAEEVREISRIAMQESKFDPNIVRG